jgi:chemotaxis protein methyltransferase CheR
MSMNAAAETRKLEFAFEDADHAIISKFIYDEVGILLPSKKKQLVYSRLAPRARSCGMESISAYVAYIQNNVEERARCIDALTTNHTSFFRENHHYEDFVGRVWPDMSTRLINGDRVRIWSAACSSGEEPYSLLMSAFGSNRSKATQLIKKDFKILATDVSSTILDKARSGRFPKALAETVPKRFGNVWTEIQDDEMVIDPLLRSAITFLELNQLGDWPMRGQFDTIFCRNVMIYFDEPTKERLQTRLADSLVLGGMMYIGHAERLSKSVSPRFECVGHTAFKKVKP